LADVFEDFELFDVRELLGDFEDFDDFFAVDVFEAVERFFEDAGLDLADAVSSEGWIANMSATRSRKA
jgi:hypothetical protein